MTSDLGFLHRDSTEKTKGVQALFERIATRYDRMNDAMSLGLHRLWKDQFIAEIPFSRLPLSHAHAPSYILDMAAGTGDIARRLWQRIQKLGLPTELILCDLNVEMLQAGQKREHDEACLGSCSWICGNAEALPLPDNQIALYTIAFGLRNVTHKETALSEALRVLKPGGFFYCLEFSHPESPWIQGLYDLYSFAWIPFLGQIIAQDRAAYSYLVESIRLFPNPALVETLIQETGFSHTGFKLLSNGLVAIHWGQKPTTPA